MAAHLECCADVLVTMLLGRWAACPCAVAGRRCQCMHDIGCPDSASIGMGCLPTLPPQVVHGGGNDSLWLQRDFGLFLVNVFDTEKACQVGSEAGPD